MRKAILIGLAVFIIIIAGAVSINWFIQAKEIRENVERGIAEMNAKQTVLTYERIETSGFPLQVEVSIINPRFSGRVDEFLLNHANAKSPLQWNGELAINGAITLGVNATSNRYTVRASGPWTTNSTIDGKTIALTSTTSGDALCVLELNRASVLSRMWSWEPLLADRDSWRNDFRLFDCVLPAYSSVDQNSGAVAMSSGGGRFYITNEAKGAEQEVRVYLKVLDSEITTAGDSVIDLYMQALAPGYPIGAPLSAYGKQNLEVDFSYLGPVDNMPKNPSLDIHLNTFNLSNAVYTSNAVFHLTNRTNGADRAAQLTFKVTSVFSEQYDVMVREMAKYFVQRLYAEDNHELAALNATLPATPDAFYATIAPAIPNFHALGTLTTAADASYQGDEKMTVGNATLTDLELSVTPYGITGKGSAKIAKESPFPAVNLTLACRNCTVLVDDLFAYAERLRNVVMQFKPEDAKAFAYHASLPEGIKGFLQALSEPTPEAANKSLFTYTVLSDGGPNVTISGKRIDEVLTLYGQYIAPFLKPPAPPETPPKP